MVFVKIDVVKKSKAVKAKRVLCHCCHEPSIDAAGRPKSVRICWPCIREGGSDERKCAVPHPRRR